MKRSGRHRREKGEIRERPVGAPEPAKGQPPTKKRLRCFNKEGSVVFIRLGGLDGWESAESAESPATALVVVGKRMGRPLVTGGSPRYVSARPLAGGPQEEWHISQLESSSERLPGLYRAFKEAEEPQREKLRGLIERVIQELQRHATVPIEQVFGQLVPGGVWSEVVRDPL